MKNWKPIVFVAVLLAVGGTLAFSPTARVHAEALAEKVLHGLGHKTPVKVPENVPVERREFDGAVELAADETKALGVALSEAKSQTAPMKLNVQGRTDYDPETLNRIRPKFRSLIDKVYVQVGQTVKQGDPLVDVFSADLAEAKGVYETKMAQWEHDRAELNRAAELRRTSAVSEKEYLSAVNDEKKTGTEAKIARDKLMVFGLSEADITNVAKEDGRQKAKMTLRAPSSGVVISKDVVPGNLYDDNDVLLTIGNLEHFWVYGYVYPSDASRVALGQTWVIECPQVGQVHEAKIESITSQIDKETKTLTIRSRIPNPKGKVKADMLVGGYIEVPPAAGVGTGRTLIPRLAMVSADGADYAFVRVPPASSPKGESASKASDRFERRKLRVLHEGADEVIVAGGTRDGEGLSDGEQVVTRGSLILQQMYEDAATVASGAPH